MGASYTRICLRTALPSIQLTTCAPLRNCLYSHAVSRVPCPREHSLSILYAHSNVAKSLSPRDRLLSLSLSLSLSVRRAPLSRFYIVSLCVPQLRASFTSVTTCLLLSLARALLPPSARAHHVALSSRRAACVGKKRKPGGDTVHQPCWLAMRMCLRARSRANLLHTSAGSGNSANSLSRSSNFCLFRLTLFTSYNPHYF